MLEWNRVNGEQIVAEYMVDGAAFNFEAIGPDPTEGHRKGEYYISIHRGDRYFFHTGVGKIEDRAKHAAENFLKLVLDGRMPGSIRMGELFVGWEKYKTSSPEFIPVAIKGSLVKGGEVHCVG